MLLKVVFPKTCPIVSKVFNLDTSITVKRITQQVKLATKTNNNKTLPRSLEGLHIVYLFSYCPYSLSPPTFCPKTFIKV